ncbi:GGDEF domain-containing protein [Methylomonas sp. OY6]|uniref:diguanylate cyclase n=1 Tax=Methylomonas defluvii TaxID=3045149 RepID=A0ABU4UEN5_9GAMM|nr:GGDEF domain-containing protein [Methylomonas sp. OY6]MDX8127921.1 GGDEF domain-containing protein [Methylomonas sp. OY6]
MTTPPDKTQLILSNTLIGKLSENSRDTSELEPYLVVLSGSDQGKQYKLHHHQHVLGREPAVDILIPDPKVSRRHGRLWVQNQHILLEDLNSTNGTYVNGKRVAKHKLELLDRILLGDTYLKIDYKRANEAKSEQALYAAANLDAMTNILNRNAFMLRAQQELSFCKRNETRLTVMMCDADHFKRTNDNFGHLAGDQVLKELAKILNAEMRQEDFLARYGGEEFIMLLRDISSDAATTLAERIRLTVMRHAFQYQNQPIPTTLSIGVCSCRIMADTSLEAIIQAADDALYRAKKNGRNRVEIDAR